MRAVLWSARNHIALALACCAAVAAAFAAPAQQKKGGGQDDGVRLHADLVVVSITVTGLSGRYAHGLTKQDFAIVEDGTPQAVESFDSEEAPFAAAILLDMSGSMEHKFSLARAAAASFLDHIRGDDQVAVYGFNNEVKRFQDFSNLRDISEYVWEAEARDETRLYDCMDEAVAALAGRAERRRALVVISDGWDSSSRKASYDSVLKKALAAGVLIYTVDLIDDIHRAGSAAVALGLRRGRHDMQEFAGQTGARYVHSPQGDKLEEAFTGIVEELRNQYTLTYYSTNDKRDGKWRRLGVSVSRRNLTTRARRGYFAPKG